MGRIVIGTSGYSYADWVGPYYPEGTSSSAFLTQYARDFALTELNFSYYRMPDPRMLSRLVEKTPDSFRFVVKAHRSITHDRAATWREDARRFAGATRELQEHGRLAGLLLQFPYSFHYTRSNRRYLAELCEALQVAGRADSGGAPPTGTGGSGGGSPSGTGDSGGAPPSASRPSLFVEYRNTEWQRESVYEEMRARSWRW